MSCLPGHSDIRLEQWLSCFINCKHHWYNRDCHKQLLCDAEERLQDCCDAVAALGEAAPAGLLAPFRLSLAGLSHFNHKVSRQPWAVRGHFESQQTAWDCNRP